MANVQKYSLSAVGHMFNHYERQTGEVVQRRNEKIDKSRTHLNYDLLTGETGDGERSKPSLQERLQKRLGEVKHMDFKSRPDLNVMCDWVITLPEDVSPEKSEQFFKAAYDFCCDRYGKENVLSAWVHMDETTPHMHFSFVPVVKNENGTERLCAKEVINRTELQKFHRLLKESVEQELGQYVAILNGKTAGGSKTIAEMEAEKAQSNLEQLEQKVAEALQQLTALQAQTTALRGSETLAEKVADEMQKVDELYQNLDTALKQKKWFKDNEKAQMKAVTEQLTALKTAVASINSTMDTIHKSVETMNGQINQRLGNAYTAIKDSQQQVERRIKRTENKIARQQKRLAEKEKAVDELVTLRVNEAFEARRRELDELEQRKLKLEEEIEKQQEQSQSLGMSNLWLSGAFTRQAQLNQQQWTNDHQRGAEQHESHTNHTTDFER